MYIKSYVTFYIFVKKVFYINKVYHKKFFMSIVGLEKFNNRLDFRKKLFNIHSFYSRIIKQKIK